MNNSDKSSKLISLESSGEKSQDWKDMYAVITHCWYYTELHEPHSNLKIFPSNNK